MCNGLYHKNNPGFNSTHHFQEVERISSEHKLFLDKSKKELGSKKIKASVFHP